MFDRAKLSAFLNTQGLDEHTLAFLSATLDESGLQDLMEVAESFLSEDALTLLKGMMEPSDVCPVDSHCMLKDVPKVSALGALAAGSLDEADVIVTNANVKPSKQEKRRAKAKAKCKEKDKIKDGGVVTQDSDCPRNLQDVAAYGLAETEEGLDDFGSFDICWGNTLLKKVKNAEKSKDIWLPCIYISIVTDLGQVDLITQASMKVLRGRRYGLIGRNGCGKTTLLRRIARRQLPGLPDLKYGYVAQELVGTDMCALDVACSGDTECQDLLKARYQIEVALEKGTADESTMAELTENFATVTCRLDEIEESFGKGGLRGHARNILLGLQFTSEMLELPTRALSGGWRMRLALAQALLSRADCLLLDEPTNHLDFAGVLWLQNFLQCRLSPECMLIMISHDRAFLDGVVTDIIEVKNKDIEQGPGNYAAWQERKAQERAAITAVVEANERERERTKEMIQHMRETAASGKKGKEADANKLRQAKQRETHLYGKIGGSSGESKTYGRLELANYNGRIVDIKALAAQKLQAEETMKMKLPEPEELNGSLLRIDGASFRIEEANRTILRNVKLSLAPNSRVAVVGSNGAGKTTLLRWLEGQQWPQDKAHRHPKLKVAHISQHHLEKLEACLSETCVDWIRSVLPPLEPGQNPNTTLSNVAKDELLFGYLAHFGLGSIGRQKLGTLSGGQKARLAFSAQVWFRPHLLLLDEPTNHLDIETLDALADALQAYKGAVVIVSHNQSFLTTVCNELWTVDAGKVSCAARDSESFAAEFRAYRRKVLRMLKASEH